MLAIKPPSHDQRVESVVDDELRHQPDPAVGDRSRTLTMRWSVRDGSPVARWTTDP